MTIQTRQLNGNNDKQVTIKALMDFAKEVLGDGWTVLHDDQVNMDKLFYTDPTGSGDQGWGIPSNSPPWVFSDGTRQQTNSDTSDASVQLELFTGFVCEGSNGSIAVGFVDTDGKYKTLWLMIKFDGTYFDKNVYAVAVNKSDGSGNIFIHGNVDIGAVNHSSNSGVGSGVYLHPIYDPVSGLSSSDVFGVRSMDSSLCAIPGTMVKQGNVSYMSMLGYPGGNAANAIFIK